MGHDGIEGTGQRGLLLAIERDAAVLAQRAQAKAPGKNLLMPKPKVDEDERRRPAPWHKHPGRRR